MSFPTFWSGCILTYTGPRTHGPMGEVTAWTQTGQRTKVELVLFVLLQPSYLVNSQNLERTSYVLHRAVGRGNNDKCIPCRRATVSLVWVIDL